MSKQLTRVCATQNNYTSKSYEAYKEWAVENCKYCIIGKEVGESGTPHLQIFFILKKRTRFAALQKKLLTATGISSHIECANGTNDQAANYIKANEDKPNPIFWEHGCYPKGRGERTDIKDFFAAVKRGAANEVLAEEYPKEFAKYHAAANKYRKSIKEEAHKATQKIKYEKLPLRKWQRHALNKALEQDDRTVTWIHDPVGNLGKSWFGNWLVVNQDAFLIEGGRNADIAEAYDYQSIVVFDYTRCQQERVNYAVIESFKNGRIFSPKYESRLKIFESCKVICLSNFDPDRTMLSADRWQVLTYDGPHKKEWCKLETTKPSLKRKMCEIETLMGETDTQTASSCFDESNDNNNNENYQEFPNDEPPRKRRKISPESEQEKIYFPSPLTFCDLCMDGLPCPKHD